jgi:Arc/MetJ-type ribon-helix-helix transcriptional regulator
LALLYITYTRQNHETLRISGDAHQKLTALLGEITAQTMKMQTYTDAIENLLSTSVMLQPELLVEIESFIDANKHLGYTTREELIREAIRFKLNSLKGQCECVEVPKEDYEKLQQAVRDLGTGYLSADDFIEQQIRGLLEKHESWLKQKEDY